MIHFPKPPQWTFAVTFRVNRPLQWRYVLSFCSRPGEAARETEEDPDGAAAAQGDV